LGFIGHMLVTCVLIVEPDTAVQAGFVALFGEYHGHAIVASLPLFECYFSTDLRASGGTAT
jgi:hypothetical protein